MEADSRLSAVLRSELSALKEKLCGTGDSLPTTVEKEALLSAINSGVCSTIAQKTELVQVACERADADGTGNKIHAENVLKHLSGDLLKDMDAENVAVAREKLNSKEKRDALVSQLGDRADPPGFIEAHKLRAMLTAVNMVGEIAFAFSPEVVGSTMRFLGVENESDDSVRISEMLRLFCPLLDQSIFAAVNEKIIDKYRSLKTAFDNLSKHEKAIKREVLVACLTDLPLERKLRNDEVQDMIDLADADGSGTIEFQEFQIIFGTGKLQEEKRQENYKRLQNKSTQKAVVRTDSIKPPDSPGGVSSLPPEQRVAEAMRERERELREAFKLADTKNQRSLDLRSIQGGFNKLGLTLKEEDVTSLLAKVSLDPAKPIDYEELLNGIQRRLSNASSLVEAQADVVAGLREVLERNNDSKRWLVRAFQILDADIHSGKSTSKFSPGELKKLVLRLRIGLNPKLVSDMVQVANPDGNTFVTYADFVRMLGDSAGQLRGLHDDSAEQLRREHSTRTGSSPGPSKQPSFSPDAPAADVTPPAALSDRVVEKLVEEDVIEEIVEETREVIKGKHDTIPTAFTAFRKTSRGQALTRQEMLDGLKRLKLPNVTDKQLEAIIKRADADGGGTIDLNEFKLAFEIGERAAAKRREDRDKKLKALLREQEKKDAAAAAAAAAAAEVIEPVDPKAEMFLWLTLQKNYDSIQLSADGKNFVGMIPQAFAFLKGREGGKHADVLSEAEFCNGLLRLQLRENLKAVSASGLKWLKMRDAQPPLHGRDLGNAELAAALARQTSFTQQEWDKFGVRNLGMDHFVGEKKAGLDRDGQGEARLNSWFRPAAADETAVTSLLRASEAVTLVQKRELLKEALGMNAEEANLALKKAGVDKTGIRPVVGESSAQQDGDVVGQGGHAAGLPLQGTQGKALFRKFNASASGWLTQGEFIHALSVWAQAHPSAMRQVEESGAAAARAPATPTKKAAGQVAPGSPQRSLEGLASVERPKTSAALRQVKNHQVKDVEKSIWPKMAKDPAAKRDAHDAVERVRREEMELLKGKFKALRQQEDRLLARNREADRREAQLAAQREVLEEREALLLAKEHNVQDMQAEVKTQQLDVERMGKQLQLRLKEVEERAAYLAEQKAALETRADQLRRLEKEIEVLPDGGGAAAATGESSVRSSKERMAQMYRDSLEQQRAAMRLSRSLASKGAGEKAGDATQLAAMSGKLKEERQEIADQMGRLEALMKHLGPPNE